MIKLEKMSNKQPELDLIAEWRNQTLISLRSNDLTAKGDSQTKWVNGFGSSEKYYFIYIDDKLIRGNSYKDTYAYLAGYCGLDKIDPVNKTAEMGLLINPKAHKKGYGTAAIKALLELAFLGFNLNCIFIEVINTTDNHLFWEKQGFVYEGYLRQRHFKAGDYYTSTVGSILQSEWKQKQNKDGYNWEEIQGALS